MQNPRPVEAESPGRAEKAKRYSSLKLILSVTSVLLSFAVTILILISGFSGAIAAYALSVSSAPYIALLIFAALFGAITGIVTFPISFYSGYVLEHKYGLSNQTLLQWGWEHLKGLLIGIPIGVPILLVFYYFLRTYESLWWLPVGIALFLFSVLLSRIAPVIILPLFYKTTPLADGMLKERILALCSKTTMNVRGIFTFNLSKTTKKANAGFTGIGRSKRIILGDTLMENFREEEIESVFAHELGHYVHGHIRKSIVSGTFIVFTGLFLTAKLYALSLGWFGFTSPDQLAALPLLTIWLGLYSFVTTPVSNILSRRHEYEADRYALKATENTEAFVSTMQKLADMNLSDAAPHPLVEWFFYSHPSIEHRIRAAEGG